MTVKGKVGMREIAAALGVSAVTVSKALAGQTGVSDGLRERITEKAREMGYVYTSKAVQRRDMGILVPERFLSPQSSFYGSLCGKVVQALGTRGCYGILAMISEEEERECQCPALLSEGRVEGLILLGQISRDYLAMLQTTEWAVPYVCLDFYDERADEDAVVSDGLYGSYCLTSHLIHMGHRRIGFVGSFKATSSIMDRYLGYCRSMLLHDLPIEADWILEDRDNRGNYLLFEMPKSMPTAFVCNCDQVAIAFMRRLNELGYEVPKDVSVVGFDDFFDASVCTPPLTTFAVDQAGMASEATNMLLDKLDGNQSRVKRLVIGGNIVYRQSVSKIC
ncbi:MAG: LacI family DNA-binding transcriptional regulator [Eubacteriales bacterium]|nr:LacI family DNA-binding transcriptional regulator [Eubacteriales bacterium]